MYRLSKYKVLVVDAASCTTHPTPNLERSQVLDLDSLKKFEGWLTLNLTLCLTFFNSVFNFVFAEFAVPNGYPSQQRT